jgi:hypothetical protein
MFLARIWAVQDPNLAAKILFFIKGVKNAQNRSKLPCGRGLFAFKSQFRPESLVNDQFSVKTYFKRNNVEKNQTCTATDTLILQFPSLTALVTRCYVNKTEIPYQS